LGTFIIGGYENLNFLNPSVAQSKHFRVGFFDPFSWGILGFISSKKNIQTYSR